MKKIKLVLFLIYCLLFSTGNVTKAQSSKVRKRSLTEDIRFYITNYFQPDKGFMNDSCINTVVYLKFKIDDNKIDSVDFSAKSPIQMKEAIKRAVLATNTAWDPTPSEIKQFHGKTFLLPIIVYYQVGCNPSMMVTKETLEKKDAIIIPQPDNPLHAALNNMLKFEYGGNYGALDCILISPLVFINFD